LSAIAGPPGAGRRELCHIPRVLRWGRFALAYAFLIVVCITVALVFRNGSLLEYPTPFLKLHGPASHVYSIAIGLTVGALIVLTTRMSVARFEWARRLHRELRPIASSMNVTGILVLALLSGIGEELLFRGLLQPWVGLLPQAVLFGFLHQVRGPSRWVWVTWATTVGLLLGGIFQLSGSLWGPIAAHALVNALNLAFLKQYDPEPRRRALGGLLG
jgi:membrane protease YdiL (CAAX protease family)